MKISIELLFILLNIKIEVCFLLLILINCQNTTLAQIDCGYNLMPDNCNPSIISKETNMWFFGKQSGLNFNNEPPSVMNVSVINQLEGGASISDTTGAFLFATNGMITMNLIDNNYREILNSDSLLGHSSVSQNSIIVPQPDSEDTYFVFTLELNIPSGKGLHYSIVKVSNDLSIISKNVELLPSVSEKITAVKHKNNRDIWIIVHEWNSKRFFSYLLTTNGLEIPVITSIGTEHTKDNFNNNAIGCLKASPDGCKLALAIYGLDIIELLDFDNATGEISNAISSSPIYPGVYGVEFSTDSKMLYATTNDYCLSSHFKSRLYQFDVDKGYLVFDDPTLITSDSIIDFLSLQLARDGKIYVASSIRENLPVDGYEYVGIIYNPTRRHSCNLNYNNHKSNLGLFLDGGKCRIGLPNFIQSYFYIPKFTYSFNCLDDITQFYIVNNSNVDSVLWDFDDGSYSIDFNPDHRFLKAKEYNVKLTDFYDGIGYTDSVKIIINPLPDVAINQGADTLFVISGSSETLDAGSGFSSYLWSTGETTQKIEIFEEGLYSVEVSTNKCCTKQDSILAIYAKIFIPTAFIPEGGATNATFNLIDYQDIIANYEMRIYDRWGGLITIISDKNNGWDGAGYSGGVYYFSIIMTLTDGKKLDKTGNVTLIR